MANYLTNTGVVHAGKPSARRLGYFVQACSGRTTFGVAVPKAVTCKRCKGRR